MRILDDEEKVKMLQDGHGGYNDKMRAVSSLLIVCLFLHGGGDDDVHDVYQKVYLWWSLCTLYLHACQVQVTLGDSGLCCCNCMTSFEC